MIDTPVQRLIKHAIDSPLKLQLLLLFAENRQFEGTAFEVAQRTFRDIWSTRAALGELTDDGILARTHVDEPVYHYRPRPDLISAIMRLYQSYNEPMERDAIQQHVRDAAIFAVHRRSSAQAYEYDAPAMVG